MTSKVKEALNKISLKTDKQRVIYEKPRVIDLGDASELTKYYSSGANNDGSSDHPRVWWN